MKVVAVSGHFDPLHEGHINLFNEAKKLGDELVVIINNEHQTKLKKGKCFQSIITRATIIKSLEMVDDIMVAIDEDETVSSSLEFLSPDIFANGGDRGKSNTPEEKLCKRLGIKTVYGVGGAKINSSSKIIGGIHETKEVSY